MFTVSDSLNWLGSLPLPAIFVAIFLIGIGWELSKRRKIKDKNGPAYKTVNQVVGEVHEKVYGPPVYGKMFVGLILLVAPFANPDWNIVWRVVLPIAGIGLLGLAGKDVVVEIKSRIQ